MIWLPPRGWDDYGGQLLYEGFLDPLVPAAGAKSDWQELVASVSADISGIVLYMSQVVDSNLLIDIGRGTAGNELVVVSNLMMDNKFVYAPGGDYYIHYIPITFATGDRITIRAQYDDAGDHWGGIIKVMGMGGNFPWPTLLPHGIDRGDTYGADISNCRGTVIDPIAYNDEGEVITAKGEWFQLTAETNYYAAVYQLYFGFAALGQNKRLEGWYLVDFATGEVGDETIIFPDFPIYNYPFDVGGVCYGVTPATIGPVFHVIPERTRLSARAQFVPATGVTLDMVEAAGVLRQFYMTATLYGSSTGGWVGTAWPGTSAGGGTTATTIAGTAAPTTAPPGLPYYGFMTFIPDDL